MRFANTEATKIIKIAIFASGAGTNAKRIIEYFKGHARIQVVLIVCNKPEAGVLTYAKEYKISSLIINKDQFFRGNSYIDELKLADVDFIVLAGFLWKVPEALIKAYPERMINIHPSLLPKYGGKGMYGLKVHEAVVAAGDKESGITIHVVDERYDNGDIVYQTTCPVYEQDTPEVLANRIHELEHEHFARVIEEYVDRLNIKEVAHKFFSI